MASKRSIVIGFYWAGFVVAGRGFENRTEKFEAIEIDERFLSRGKRLKPCKPYCGRPGATGSD
jgi:hypothetical protein